MWVYVLTLKQGRRKGWGHRGHGPPIPPLSKVWAPPPHFSPWTKNKNTTVGQFAPLNLWSNLPPPPNFWWPSYAPAEDGPRCRQGVTPPLKPLWQFHPSLPQLRRHGDRTWSGWSMSWGSWRGTCGGYVENLRITWRPGRSAPGAYDPLPGTGRPQTWTTTGMSSTWSTGSTSTWVLLIKRVYFL